MLGARRVASASKGGGKMQTSILIVDPQRMVREGIRGILDRQPQLEVVAEAADAGEAVESARTTQPHVALVETQLPHSGGVEAIRAIREASPRTRCIALSSQQSPSCVRQALLAGAVGFVPKDSTAEELVEAVRAVRSGRSYLAPSLGQHVVGAIAGGGPDGSGSPEISGRQRQVLCLIAEGLTTREIAVELGISEKTAQTHRAKLMDKIGVRKASGLVRYAVRNGIVSA
jgi:DNA-binding NarL/FixJ family response regulator